MDVVDHTAQLELRMREKVALSLSQMDKDEFANAIEGGNVNFLVLSSVRVLVRKMPAGKDDATEPYMSANIVEAAEQDLLIPKAMPDASMTFVSELLKSLPPTSDRMIVAPSAFSESRCTPA